MEKNIIKEKSFEFALAIIRIYQCMIESKKEYVLSKQLLRSGTTIGALIREAEQAENKADFIHKLSIALKEANETEYWITLLFKSGIIGKERYSTISDPLIEILRLLTSIIKTSKQNLKNQQLTMRG